MPMLSYPNVQFPRVVFSTSMHSFIRLGVTRQFNHSDFTPMEYVSSMNFTSTGGTLSSVARIVIR